MSRLRVAIHDSPDRTDETIAFDALDMATAIAIVDINLANGNAEIWEGEHRLARLDKLGEARTTYWRVT